jgi:hypothetical protein
MPNVRARATHVTDTAPSGDQARPSLLAAQLAISAHFPCAHRGRTRVLQDTHPARHPAPPSDRSPTPLSRPSDAPGALAAHWPFVRADPYQNPGLPFALRQGHSRPFHSIFFLTVSRVDGEDDVTLTPFRGGARGRSRAVFFRVRAHCTRGLFGFGLCLARAVFSLSARAVHCICVHGCD